MTYQLTGKWNVSWIICHSVKLTKENKYTQNLDFLQTSFQKELTNAVLQYHLSLVLEEWKGMDPVWVIYGLLEMNLICKE